MATKPRHRCVGENSKSSMRKRLDDIQIGVQLTQGFTNHGRKAICFVRLGWDHLQDTIGNFDCQWKEFRHYCRLHS